ncbi:MAG: GntR family transcriptional regulator [Sneathiellaceae bacterium]
MPSASALPLQQRAVAEIREDLIHGRFRPGERLSEPELASRFQTSRSPVREALVQLEHEGFLERAKTGRVYVRPLELSEAEQLFVFRGHLEGLAARLAAENMNLKDIQRLEANLAAMETAAQRGDARVAMECGAEFHRTIIDACGNRPLLECLEGLRARVSRYRYILAAIDEFSEQRVREHRSILSALAARSPATAEQAMINHVEVSSRETLHALKAFLSAPEKV